VLLGIPVAQTQVRELVGIKRNVSVMRDPEMFGGVGAANDFKNLAEEVVLPHLSTTLRSANE
jgi:hypothetical protein